MRSKVTVVLLFLNVVLFAYIYYYEAVKLPPDANSMNVYGSEAATIDSITRLTRNSPTVRLEKNKDAHRGDAWVMTQPFEWPAQIDAVERLLNELKLLKHETSFAVADLAKSGQTLTDFGLDQPAMTLIFTSAGKTYTTKIGDATQVGNRLYLLAPDGKTIHVVGRGLADSLALPISALRSESVFTVPVFEVRSLNVQTAASPGLKVRLRRDSSAHWNFESPIQARASKSYVEITIAALNLLKAKTFLDPRDIDLEKAGLGSPAIQVTLEGNARREILLLGNVVPPPPNAPAAPAARPEDPAPVPSTEYYAKIEDKPIIFTVAVPNPLVEALQQAQEKLRDPHVLEFEPATVTSLTIAAPGQTDLILQRLEAGTGEQGWQEVTRITGQAPLTTAADSAVVTELLQKLHGLTVERFLSDFPAASDIENYGFNRPERVITLNLNTGGGPQGTDPLTLTLQIGVAPDKAGIAYARTPPAAPVYQILPDILNATPVVPRLYRQRLLRELPEGARITGLNLTDLTTNTPVYAKTLADTDKNWGPTLNAETEARRKAIAVLLVQLRTLRALFFAAENFNPDHADTAQGPRPWKYRLDYTVAFPSGSGTTQNSTSTLFLTERLAGSTLLAGSSDFGGVTFAVTQDMLDALFALTNPEKIEPGAPTPPVAAPVPAPGTTPAMEPAANGPAPITTPAAAAPAPTSAAPAPPVPTTVPPPAAGPANAATPVTPAPVPAANDTPTPPPATPATAPAPKK